MKRRLFNWIAVITLAFTIASCVDKTPLTGTQQVYAGKWIASDGTYIQIYLDGGGDFKGSNTSIEGGATSIKGNEINIGLGPVQKTFKITKQPYTTAGKISIELDGIEFTKTSP
ncbi:hypothetical protein [Merismopedia glauca]|uniref:Lipoprotein n=1 Tax=Merismopedia glauca CCAP 1448/3 TaxID=1296344 RepID=A0A2T1BXI0_9CYAN|nr:hypothetical protein [Merismopedia glauca]PSB00617.1 hypothetical protein C7B64_22580 [Merismopedia glauca CCAP 1448/3]